MNLSSSGSTEKRRRFRTEAVLMALLAVMAAIVFWLQSKLLKLPQGLETPNILFWALINLNIILILLLLFLILRNTAKLAFERKSRIIGAKLRTKLTLAFVGFALLPTGLFFFLTYAFISNSLERWFELKEKASGESSLSLVMNLREFYCNKALLAADVISSSIVEQKERVNLEDKKIFEQFLDELRYRAGANFVIAKVSLKDREEIIPIGIKPAELEHAYKRIKLIETSELIPLDEAGLNLAAIAERNIDIGTETTPKSLTIWAGFTLGSALSKSISDVTKAYEQTQQFLLLKTPLKVSHTIVLILISSLILFGSSWFAIYLARGMTEPIKELSEATERVAKGDLNIELKAVPDDELGQLSKSFEKMTRELKQSRFELERTAQELEQRKQYLETLLLTVSSGVVALDSQGRITTINDSAKAILQIETNEPLGKFLVEVLPIQYRNAISPILEPILSGYTENIAKKFEIHTTPETRSIWASATCIKSGAKPIGAVLVVEELTQLLRAERLEEWRVVTEYLAHDIKNPLTAIRTASEAIKLALEAKHDVEPDIVACSEAIIRQTEGLKRLVERLGHLARADELRKKKSNLNRLISEVVNSYSATHPHIEFKLMLDESLTEFDFDPEQIERVLINLIDNSIAAIDSEGEIFIATKRDGNLAKIKVADNGKGIPEELLGRLFEPHFSTKRRGTGLGLAISHKIITEHGGKIEIEPNKPKGTIVSIELPIG